MSFKLFYYYLVLIGALLFSLVFVICLSVVGSGFSLFFKIKAFYYAS